MISVCIPTFRRPDGFLRAAFSVFAQESAGGIELVAIDNSPEGSALDLFRELERNSPIPFRWAHEPRPGVSHARNAALPLARGDLIAWLDDDEEAPPSWLAALARVQRETGADCVFGPVKAQAPHATPHATYYERLYSRAGPHESGAIDRSFGIGNSLHVRARMFASDAPFATSANETGGEDDLLFAAARRAGARFAWAAEAGVIEHLDSKRLTLSHALRRAFAYGQGPCETAWAERDFLALARHMGVGAGQAVLFGLASAYAWLGDHNNTLPLLDRAARGAGKVFWGFEQRFYGEALAARD